MSVIVATTCDVSCSDSLIALYIPLLKEQRVLGGPYIVGTTDDRTFFLLWIRVIWLPYLATYEPSNPMCMRRARVATTCDVSCGDSLIALYSRSPHNPYHSGGTLEYGF